MDLLEELEQIIAVMDWEEVVDTMTSELMENIPNPPSPSLEFNTHLKPTQSADLDSQAGAHSQGQCDIVPVLKPSVPTAPPSITAVSKKKKYKRQPDDGRPYIKKPPNAFMLFRKEQAPNVNAELNITGAAVVNTVLGQRWKNLSREEQAKYYEQAKEEKQLHTQHFPEWSCKNNYGKMRKRIRKKVHRMAEASVSSTEEATEQAMNVRVSPVTAAVKKPSATPRARTRTVEDPHAQTGVMEAPHSLPHKDSPVSAHVCGSDDLPQTSEHRPQCTVSCEQPPRPASTGEEETLLMEKLAHKVPTLHTFNISPLYFYYMD